MLKGRESQNETQINLSLKLDSLRKHALGPGGGGYSLIWVTQVCATGLGMVFWPRHPKQGIQFDLPLS